MLQSTEEPIKKILELKAIYLFYSFVIALIKG